MTVYLVFMQQWEDVEMQGVYATATLAQAAIDQARSMLNDRDLKYQSHWYEPYQVNEGQP